MIVWRRETWRGKGKCSTIFTECELHSCTCYLRFFSHLISKMLENVVKRSKFVYTREYRYTKIIYYYYYNKFQEPPKQPAIYIRSEVFLRLHCPHKFVDILIIMCSCISSRLHVTFPVIKPANQRPVRSWQSAGSGNGVPEAARTVYI